MSRRLRSVKSNTWIRLTQAVIVAETLTSVIVSQVIVRSLADSIWPGIILTAVVSLTVAVGSTTAVRAYRRERAARERIKWVEWEDLKRELDLE